MHDIVDNNYYSLLSEALSSVVYNYIYVVYMIVVCFYAQKVMYTGVYIMYSLCTLI